MSQPPLTDTQREARAKSRFFMLAGLRFAGVFVVMFGLALMMEAVPGFEGNTGRYAGFLLAVMGTFDVLVLPVLLARYWKKRDAA